MRRLNEALNQPFRRSGATIKGKDPEPDSTAAARLRPPAAPRRPITEDDTISARRSPSPDWNIELDLNEPDDNCPNTAPPPWEQDSNVLHSAGSPRRTMPPTRQYSPDWDIDVDSEGDVQAQPPSPPGQFPAKKKRRPNVFTIDEYS